VLGVPVGTIRSRVARARLDLVELMTDATSDLDDESGTGRLRRAT
jgi:DNA-directed RNA polymerase specialized sigma24 family protein